jgi:hypothetical protein
LNPETPIIIGVDFFYQPCKIKISSLLSCIIYVRLPFYAETQVSLSKTKGFRLEFPEGYQYYSKPDMVALFRNDGCKMVEVLVF